jgi:hypothetical protein
MVTYMLRYLAAAHSKFRSNKWVILGGLVIFSVQILQGCGGVFEDNNSHTYPARQVQEFTDGCKSTLVSNIGEEKAGKLCSCMITEIQKKYTLGQFKEVAKQIEKNNTPLEVTNIATECVKKDASLGG